MATKADLEQEVEQLKAQLASGLPPDAVAMTAELDKLKADLEAVSDERDKAGLDLATCQAQLAASGDLDAKVSAALTQALLDKDDLAKQLAAVKQDLQVAQDAAAQKPAAGPVCEGNHASVDGKTYDILWRSTVKDLVYEGYHKRHVDENHTAIVVAKVGG